MKKLNNKGFTLVELLAVVVILVIIMLVAIPNISSSIERRKIKNEAKMKEIIISAGESYANNQAPLKYCDYAFCVMRVSDLVDKGYLIEKEVNDYKDYCFNYSKSPEYGESYDSFGKETCNIVSTKCANDCTPPQ